MIDEILNDIFGDKIKWTGSREDFLDFVVHISNKVEMERHLPNLVELGNHMANIIKPDFAPFESFTDLLIKGRLTGTFHAGNGWTGQ